MTAKKASGSAWNRGTRKFSAFLVKLLDVLEKAGNRLPDPLTLFVIFSFGVIVLSWIAHAAGWSVVHPATGRTITADSLLSDSNIRRMFTDMVRNFASFPPLGLVLVTMIGIGVAERSGLVTVALRRMVTLVPSSALPAALVFTGIMSSLAADAGYVVLVPLGAVLFAGFGRHPIAGLAATFAGVSGGFSANLLLTSLDPMLSGISTEAARILDPKYFVSPSANYYFMIFSTILLTIVGTWVTTRIIEPRLGKWNPADGDGVESLALSKLTPVEKKGLWAASAVFVLTLAAIAWVILPGNSIFRDSEQNLRPFYEALVPIIMLMFLLCGLAYGWVAGSIRSDRDVANMASETMATMGSYIVLAFVAAQFVAYFSWSNLGVIFAVSGAEALQAIGFSGVPLLLAFILVVSIIDFFIGSASAKWAIMGPVFIPMLMVMGYSPELVQAAYRVGDSITNIVTPLLPYFPIIIAFARKYDRKLGIGTLISVMVPYSVAFGIVWALSLVIWFAFGLPLGPDAPLIYTGAAEGVAQGTIGH